jgi:hypothetical protein
MDRPRPVLEDWPHGVLPRRALRRKPYGGGPGNYCDVDTDEDFWVSGVKKVGTDRHWAGSGSSTSTTTCERSTSVSSAGGNAGTSRA